MNVIWSDGTHTHPHINPQIWTILFCILWHSIQNYGLWCVWVAAIDGLFLPLSLRSFFFFVVFVNRISDNNTTSLKIGHWGNFNRFECTIVNMECEMLVVKSTHAHIRRDRLKSEWVKEIIDRPMQKPTHVTFNSWCHRYNSWSCKLKWL